jgi:hypothetical protein
VIHTALNGLMAYYSCFYCLAMNYRTVEIECFYLKIQKKSCRGKITYAGNERQLYIFFGLTWRLFILVLPPSVKSIDQRQDRFQR